VKRGPDATWFDLDKTEEGEVFFVNMASANRDMND
jgi:hypothetical protein